MSGVGVCAVVAGGVRTPFLLERFPTGTAVADVIVMPTEETS